MKRIVSKFLLAVAVMAPTMAHAENLTADQAREAGAYYMRCNTTRTRLTADQLTLARQWNNTELGVPSMYLFTTDADAWIIMAASTVIHPVVAFSDESYIDPDNIVPQFAALLEQHNEWVCNAQKNDAENKLSDNPIWTKMVNQTMKVNNKAANYLLNTRWDQGEGSGTTYNMYSPKIGSQYCYTGCVATALAQICKYYSYPKVGKGTKSYTWYYTENGANKSKFLKLKYTDSTALDYNIMPNKLTSTSSLDSRKEVSRLAYYIGVAVEMQFGTYYEGGGSGTSSDLVVPNMRTYLKYEQGTDIYRRRVTDTSFINKVTRELELNRPVYMAGASTTGDGRDADGHAWVCDGFRVNEDTMYHMNWGWGGTDNNFYNLIGNDMYCRNQDLNFNRNRGGYYQTAIIGMIPPRDSTDRPVYVGVPEVEGRTTLGMAYPNPATLEVVLPYSSDRASDMQVYSVDGRLVWSERLHAGDGEMVLNVAGMPAGIYIYRMGDAHGKFVVR